jgi:pimeloyl-ACP methyl ester carboxylesterase
LALTLWRKLATGDMTSTEADATKSTEVTIASTDGVELVGHLAEPARMLRNTPVVLFVHGFPSGDVWAQYIGADLPNLADRAARRLSCRALAIRFRGCGDSTGNFSLRGWQDDVEAALEFCRALGEGSHSIWLVGFGTGAAVGLCAAAQAEDVGGMAVVAAPADFDDWASRPAELLTHARHVGAISDDGFPKDLKSWKAQLSAIRATSGAEVFAPRPLLVLHGSEDVLVPQFDGRSIADAHGEADLRVIASGGHQLRHDPRAMSVLLGWLDRKLQP